MRLLARYLLRECLVALAVCFSAFLLFWTATDLISELPRLQDRRLRAIEVAQYYFYRVPEFLPIAVPVSLLLAFLYALTNHARHNEITAMRAAGVSLWRLSLPYFSIALIASAALFAVNETVGPTADAIADDILNQHVRGGTAEERELVKGLMFTNTRDGRSWFVGAYDQSTGRMRPTVVVDWRKRDGSLLHIDSKGGAVYTNGSWTFYNVAGWTQAAGAGAPQMPLPRQEALAMPEFSETPEQVQSEIEVTSAYARQRRTRRADLPISVIVNYLRLHPKPNPAIRDWLYTKLHGRLAAPATCIVVVLLALPFAAASGRRNVFVGVATSIVVFFAFYMLQQFGFAFAENGRVPAWFGAWFPNIMAATVGLLLMARVR